MTNRTRGVIVGLSGFFAGAATARIVHWSSLPKAALAGLVAALVATVVLIVTHPRQAKGRKVEGADALATQRSNRP